MWKKCKCTGTKARNDVDVDPFPPSLVTSGVFLHLNKHRIGRPNQDTCSDEFFRYTSGNWLCNDEAQKAARRVKFNVSALCRIAANAIGARSVTQMFKISESINKVFLLRFDNGCEAIARIPTPLSGPSHYTIASEVATMDFLRRKLDLPIPTILAWSSRPADTDVGSEFIIMEKASGILLSEIWDNVELEDQAHFARTLGKLMKRLVQLKFSHFGSIYYKKDVPEELRAPTLFDGPPEDDDISTVFCIGPISRRDFWLTERASMAIDRGPWKCAEDHMLSVAKREEEWIARHGTPHFQDDPYRILPFQGDSEEHIELLKAYKLAIPYFTPPRKEQIAPTLWHPDLHASNVLVKRRAMQGSENPQIPLEISSIIDWQGAWVGPAFLQLKVPLIYHQDEGVPSGLRLPPLPDDYDELEEKEQEKAHNKRQRIIMHKLFEASAFPAEIIKLKARLERLYLEQLVREIWSYGAIPFRALFANIYHRWDDIMPGTECPFPFPDKELAEIERQHDMYVRHQEFLEDLNKEFGLGEFGYVAGDADHFARVRAAVDKKKAAYIAEGKDDGEREARKLLWPFRETPRDRESVLRLRISEA